MLVNFLCFLAGALSAVVLISGFSWSRAHAELDGEFGEANEHFRRSVRLLDAPAASLIRKERL